MTHPDFAAIRARAEARKGDLAPLLPPPHPQVTADDRVLAEMTKRIFCSGFVWSVIEGKWEGFEAAFHRFDPGFLAFQPDEFWDALTKDARIVRNGAKIMAVRANARFVCDLAAEHGSAASFIHGWPAEDQLGLLDVLTRRGNRLGGMTGQYLLRFLGRDGYILNTDGLACLRAAGVFAGEAPGKKDLARIQATYNRWHRETGLSYAQLSRICAMSIGENK